jgi:hypothetical protein
MDYYQSDDRIINKRVATAVFAVIAIIGLYFLYMQVIKPLFNNTGDPDGYDSRNIQVDNDPRGNPHAMEDGTPRFTSGLLTGYSCLRCSDSGSTDSELVQSNAQVKYQCAVDESASWNRAESFLLKQTAKNLSPGNWIQSDPANPKPNQDELEHCKGICGSINSGWRSTIGTCKAVTYDRATNMCSFFYSCDKVEKTEGTSSFLLDFSPEKQPTVVNPNL